MLEMKEASFICKHATEKSLILIDELGRATSNEDGVAIAWAVSEHLLTKRAMTFFVTHYPQLSRLSLAYPSSVQNMHMNSIISGEDNSELCYTHKIRLGPCKMKSDYGVEMAPMCGWPVDVVNDVSIDQTTQLLLMHTFLTIVLSYLFRRERSDQKSNRFCLMPLFVWWNRTQLAATRTWKDKQMKLCSWSLRGSARSARCSIRRALIWRRREVPWK